MIATAFRGTTGPATRKAWRATALALAALGALAFAASARGIAVTCDYAASGKFVEVRITESNKLIVMRVSNGTIQAFDYITPAACTSNPPGLTPTVTNTDVIAVAAEAGVRNTTLIIDNAPAFAPGASPETGTPEIEMFINLRDTEDSLLSVRTGGAGSLRFGTFGIDTNATPSEADPDIDINTMGVGDFDGRSSVDFQQPVTLDASGGGPTGGPMPKRMELLGSRAVDTLIGGDGGDDIFAAEGADIVRGGAGDDKLTAGPGDDTIDGGAGTDVDDESQAGLTTGLVVDLARSGAQPTGGAGSDTFTSIENVRATPFIDILSGNGAPNVLESGNGADFLDGRGGADTLRAGPGADTIKARDGVSDTVDCGDDVDTVTADERGVDKLTGCETVDFATTPVAGGGGGGGGGGPGAGGPAAATRPVVRPLVVSPATFTALTRGPSARPAGRRFGGALVAFAVDRPATVTFRVARRAAGLRARGRCVAPARAPSGARRCARLVVVRGSFVRRAIAGSNRFAFSGRVGGRTLVPGAYQLRAVARADGLTGPKARAAFRIAG